MPDECHLWTNLSSAGPRAHSHVEPIAYLHFPSTGLVVGLPDEPGLLIDSGRPGQITLREADAAGLGLTADDTALGVAYCSSVVGEVGWSCDAVDLVVRDADGELRSLVILWSQSAVDVPATAEPGAPVVSRAHAMRPRALVYVTERTLASGALAAVAALARELDARVVLGAVGELPESGRHAEEEQRSLHRLLVDAAPLFGGRVAALRVELGGDPVHGLLALAAEECATVVLVPEDSARRSHGEELTGQLRRRLDVPVEWVPRPDPRSRMAHGVPPVRESAQVMRRLAISIGAHGDTPPWERPEAWPELVSVAVRERLGSAAPVPAGAECSLTARWFVHPEHPGLEELTRRLPVEAIAKALVNAEYVSPSQLAASRTRVEFVETDRDLVEHVVAVLRC